MERNSLVVAVEMGRAQVFPLGPEPPTAAVLDIYHIPDTFRLLSRQGDEVREEGVFDDPSEALEKAREVLAASPARALELQGDGGWRMALCPEGAGPAAGIVVTPDLPTEVVPLRGEFTTAVLEFDIWMEVPRTYVLGVNGDRVLSEDDLKLLLGKKAPRNARFWSLRRALKVADLLLREAPEGELVSLELEGQDRWADTLWAVLLWEKKEAA